VVAVTLKKKIAKPGGRIIVLGECAEGIGSAEFARRIERYSGHADFLDEIRAADVEIDQWQLEKLALCGLKHELYFYTPGVKKAELGSLGLRAFDDLNEAIAAALDGLPADARVVLVPEGPYTFARAEEPVTQPV